MKISAAPMGLMVHERLHIFLQPKQW